MSYETISFKYEIRKDTLLRAAFIRADSRSAFRSIDTNAFARGARPDSLLGQVSELNSIGYKSVDKVGVSFDTKLRGIPLLSHYVYTRDRNDTDDLFSLPSSDLKPRVDLGPASGVPRHVFAVSMRISADRFSKSPLLKNLDLEIETRTVSGLPYSITTGNDENADSIINDRPKNVSRNSERGEFSLNTNVGVNWSLPRVLRFFGKGLEKNNSSLTLRLEINNLFNRTNKQGYIGVQSSPLFGQPTFSDPARSLRLGISYSF